MLQRSLPVITCYLTDRNGTVLNPYAPGAVSFSAAVPSGRRKQKQVRLPCGKQVALDRFTVSIRGFIAVSADGRTLSSPIPFCTAKSFYLYAPKGTRLTFRLGEFNCCALPVPDLRPVPGPVPMDRVRISLFLEPIVHAMAKVDLLVPEVIPASFSIGDPVCVDVEKIFDSTRFSCEVTVFYQKTVLKAEVYHYNALGEEDKRLYTNSDELLQYGSRGILSPGEVSYFELYINGVLQPETNYTVEKGRLFLKSVDFPLAGSPLIITFITYSGQHNEKLNAATYSYNTVSDGVRCSYTNADEIRSYGNRGIPDPREVSYCNLFINGVLQPKTNYRVKKGLLLLTTADIPLKGAPMVLEFLTIRGSCNQLLRVDTYQYNAYSEDKRIYTDQDELTMYGDQGIPDPDSASWQELFVNGVLQPEVTYLVQKDLLALKTEDLPQDFQPISLQFITCYL